MQTGGSGRGVDVAIIGGGAGGTLVATRLLADAASGPGVALVEPRGAPGEGIAYSTRRPEHLLNVRAAGMSAFDERPDDFVRFLRRLPEHADTDAAALAAGFMPRWQYARYLSATLQAQPGFARLHTIADVVRGVEPAAGGFRVTLGSGEALRAGAVVLALGNLPARLPLADGGAPPTSVVEAWDYPAVAAIDAGADVCIVGAGLSMVDVVLSLDANGHRGRIVALSRHGLLPLPHAAASPSGDDVAQLLPLGVRARMRTLRAWAERERVQGRAWQGVLDALRPHVQALWTSLPPAEQRRFLRHAVRHWDVHRHRVAPEVAAAVERLRAAGRLELLAGRLVSAEEGRRWRLAYRPRGGGDAVRIGADVLVNATGMEKRVERASAPPIPGLLARGWLRPGSHGIGVDTAADGAVFDRTGARVPGLWTLGSFRVGTLWESIAIPELRGQAADVAESVRAHLAAAH